MTSDDNIIDNIFIILHGWEIYKFEDLYSKNIAIFAQNSKYGITINRNAILYEYWHDFLDIAEEGKILNKVNSKEIPEWLIKKILDYHSLKKFVNG